MTTAEQSIDVDVPVRTAYDQWTQFESFPEFMSGVESITQVDATHNHWVTKIAGVQREFDTEITEQTPDQRIAWKATGGVKHAGVVTFHRLGEGVSRVTLQMDMEPEGLAEQVADKTGLVSHQAKADMARFKEFIENRGQATGSYRGEVTAPTT